MSSTIRVGFLSSKNYLDKNTFSGTLFHMHRALGQHSGIELVNLSNPRRPRLNPPLLNRLVNNLHKKAIELQPDRLDYFEKRHQFAAVIAEQLKKMPCDVIFAPVAAVELNCLQTDTPLIYLSDTTSKLYCQLYQPDWPQQKIDIINQAESNAIMRADQLIYSSSWAAASAIADYGASSEKINVIPFGANLDNVPLKDSILQAKAGLTCKLLFIGKKWERKGGSIAYQTLISLLSLGIDAELTVIGCIPPSHISHDRLKVIPFLDKEVPNQRRRMEQIFLQSHFLLFPTRADCSPIVICEANALGLPVITSDVGGIPTIIRNGINGYMFSLSASGEEYAECIAEIFSDSARYKQLSESAREEYEERLNWRSWANSFYQVAEKAIEPKPKIQLTLH